MTKRLPSLLLLAWLISACSPASSPPTAIPDETRGAPPSAAYGVAAFTGRASDVGCDPDGNGLFEYLQVDVEVDVVEAGGFSLRSDLSTVSRRVVAWGSVDSSHETAVPLTCVDLGTGVQRVPIYFDGAGIRAWRLGGPLAVSAELFDGQGTSLDTLTFTITSYSPLDFQGFLVELRSLSDAGLDTDTMPGYNLLRVAVQINMLATGDLHASGSLFAGSASLAFVERDMTGLDAGVHTLNLDFPGEVVAVSRVDGPYTVYLYLSDGYYSDQWEHTTAAYSHTEFQAPDAFFTGNVSDAGRDTDGDGLYDRLDVTVEVAALARGTYSLHGILEDGAGDWIETTEEEFHLDGESTEVVLHFDGLLISRRGTDGPYQVGMALLDAYGNDLDGLVHSTEPYAHTDFERPGASLNASFSESAVDGDGDGFLDLLRIEVGVEVVDAGVYITEGSLLDRSGDFITWDLEELFLDAGVHTVSLEFDGSAIRGHGVDGPYRLVSLSLERPDVGRIDSAILVYTTTVAYAYTDFRSPPD